MTLRSFGSLVMSSSTGIFLNNHIDDFSFPGRQNTEGLLAAPRNRLAPGKRPMSSVAPSMVTDVDGKLLLLISSTGGPTAITGLAQVCGFS